MDNWWTNTTEYIHSVSIVFKAAIRRSSCCAKDKFKNGRQIKCDRIKSTSIWRPGPSSTQSSQVRAISDPSEHLVRVRVKYNFWCDSFSEHPWRSGWRHCVTWFEQRWFEDSLSRSFIYVLFSNFFSKFFSFSKCFRVHNILLILKHI